MTGIINVQSKYVALGKDKVATRAGTCKCNMLCKFNSK